MWSIVLRIVFRTDVKSETGVAGSDDRQEVMCYWGLTCGIVSVSDREFENRSRSARKKASSLTWTRDPFELGCRRQREFVR